MDAMHSTTVAKRTVRPPVRQTAPLRKRGILIVALTIFLTGLLAICFAPFIVSHGLRLWLSWKARQENLTVTIDKLEAPFLRPVVMRGVRLTTAPGSPFRIDFAAAQATVALDLRAIVQPARGRIVQSLQMAGIHAEMHRDHSGATISKAGWRTLQRLLPGNANFAGLDLRVENGATVFLLRGSSLSVTEVQGGDFSAREIMIVSPWLRQSFSNLRGATRWQGNRLTVGGLTLTRGLDLQWITADLSQLGNEFLGLQFEAAVFGGNIRADISNEWNSKTSAWNVAGSVGDVSLAQTSEVIGLADRAEGLLHACKFTFRGDPRDVTRATTSIWAELTDLQWRGRAAETIMFGATIYNRQIQLQELYLKQSDNELTLSGEGALIASPSGWLDPVFRGDVSASISNLGEFAALFGANPGDFAGQISVEGTMNARDRKIGGHLTAAGKSLSIFKAPIDSFTTKLNLKATELEIEQLELHHRDDFARASGKIDVAREHEYSGTATFSAANLADYAYVVPATWKSALRRGAASGDWSGTGNRKSHTGRFHFTGRGLVLAAPMESAPFDADLDAAYTPANIFFRQFHISNATASLDTFLTIAPEYIQLQAFAFDIDGQPQVRGNMFVPVALGKLEGPGGFRHALDPDQKVDVDLNFEPTDLTKLARALTGRANISGLVAGRFLFFGGLNALQGWGEVHLRDLASVKDPKPISAELESRFSSGTMNTQGRIQFRDSEPIALQISAPIQLGTKDDAAHLEPINASINFPRVLLGHLPSYLSRGWFGQGTVSGKLAVSQSLIRPKIVGDLQLTNINLSDGPLRAAMASGHLTFRGTTAAIDSLNLGTIDVDLPFRGDIDFADANAISMKLLPGKPMANLTSRDLADCVGRLTLSPVPAGQPAASSVEEILFAGGLGKPWTVTLQETHTAETTAGSGEAKFKRTFPLCPGPEGAHKALVLGSEPVRPSVAKEKFRPRKPRKHP